MVQQVDSSGKGDSLFLSDPFLGQSAYDFNHRVFPVDLAQTSYEGHYMIININVSNKSVYSTVSTPQGPVNNFNKLDQLSKVDALRSFYDQNFTAGGTSLGYGSVLGINGFLPRFTTRIVESIALYIPGTVAYGTNNVYEDISLTNLVGSGVSAAAGLVSKGLNALGLKGVASAIDFSSRAAGAAASAADRAAKIAGYPINPRVEILFSNTLQRQFQFDFLFAPRSKEESDTLEQIIHTIRFHAAPEISPISGIGGILWVPPSEFDITFYYRGQENTHIPRINTCVLENIDLDYAPSGVWSTFSNGYPVQIRMQLKFRETEVAHRLRIQQGF